MTAPGTKRVVPQLKLTWGGALGVPNLEIWSNGVTFGFVDANAAPSEAEVRAVVDAIAEPLRLWHVGAASGISATASLQWTKAVWLLANGKQRDTNTARHDFPANTFGQGGSAIWAQTYAITLRTKLARGRSHSGRIFPPAVGFQPEAKTPYAAAGSVEGMAAGFAQLLMSMQTAIHLVLNPTNDAVPQRVLVPSVSSPGDTVTGVVPLLEPITGVVVDRVADIQHRRTNRVPRNEGPLSAYPVPQ